MGRISRIVFSFPEGQPRLQRLHAMSSPDSESVRQLLATVGEDDGILGPEESERKMARERKMEESVKA